MLMRYHKYSRAGTNPCYACNHWHDNYLGQVGCLQVLQVLTAGQALLSVMFDGVTTDLLHFLQLRLLCVGQGVLAFESSVSRYTA